MKRTETDKKPDDFTFAENQKLTHAVKNALNFIFKFL